MGNVPGATLTFQVLKAMPSSGWPEYMALPQVCLIVSSNADSMRISHRKFLV